MEAYTLGLLELVLVCAHVLPLERGEVLRILVEPAVELIEPGAGALVERGHLSRPAIPIAIRTAAGEDTHRFGDETDNRSIGG